MSLVGADATVVASPGCGSPTTLLRGLADRSHSVPVRLLTGLQIDGYPFLDRAHPHNFRMRTWHVTGPLRDRLDDGTVDYVPARASHVSRLLRHWGADVTLIRVSPADRNGYHCLGPSASYPLSSARRTAVVIAEIDPEVPRTFGSWIHESRLDATVDAEHPMPVYRTGEPDELSRTIARLVADRLPEQPVLQLGIGSIPEALTCDLATRDLGPIRFCGMATDAMVELAEQGALDTAQVYPDPAILAAELMGGPTLMTFANENPLVGVRESALTHDPTSLGRLERFVSINSAIEVDLTGQVNAESVRGRQISGIGGSVDYVEAAGSSPGGLRVVALPSTTADGRHSRIVPSIPAGNTVTLPRGAVDIVVTEHGVADLRGLGHHERREALLEICDPSFRDEIASTDVAAHEPPTRPKEPDT